MHGGGASHVNGGCLLIIIIIIIMVRLFKVGLSTAKGYLPPPRVFPSVKERSFHVQVTSFVSYGTTALLPVRRKAT